MSEYGIDIVDLSGPRLSWPRFQRLISQLPRESRTLRAVVGDAVRWGELEHLVATLIDVQSQSNWMYAAAHSKRTPPFPPPLHRPGTPEATVQKIGGKRSYTREEFDKLRASARPKAGVSS